MNLSLMSHASKKKVQKDHKSEKSSKIHIFWEGHKILQYLHQLFHWQYIGQIIGGDFEKMCGLLSPVWEIDLPNVLLRIYEL